MKATLLVGAVFCLLCCGALGQLPAEDASNLQDLLDAWDATMAATTVKISKVQTSTASAQGDDTVDSEQKITTTLYLRKVNETDSTDEYAIIKMEGNKDLEAEVVSLGDAVYTKFKSGVDEDALGQWFEAADLVDPELDTLSQNFADATTLTLISDQLQEGNIESISIIEGGSEEPSATCYDIVPTEAYSATLAEEGSTIEVTHQICVDTETGYFISSKINEDQVTPVVPFADEDFSGIVVSTKIDTEFSEFNEEVEFPQVLDEEADSSSQLVKCSSITIVAATVLSLLI